MSQHIALGAGWNDVVIEVSHDWDERERQREREGEYDSDAKHFQPISWTKSARLESQEEHHYVMLLIQFLFLLFRRCFYFWNIVSFERFFQVRFKYTFMFYIVSFAKMQLKQMIRNSLLFLDENCTKQISNVQRALVLLSSPGKNHSRSQHVAIRFLFNSSISSFFVLLFV